VGIVNWDIPRLEMIDLDIGFEEFELDKSPEEIRDLIPELQQVLKQAG